MQIFLVGNVNFHFGAKVVAQTTGGKFQHDGIGRVVNDAYGPIEINGIGANLNCAYAGIVVLKIECSGIENEFEFSVDARLDLEPDGIQHNVIDLDVAHLRCQLHGKRACNDLPGVGRSFNRYGQHRYFHSKVFTEEVPPGTFYVYQECLWQLPGRSKLASVESKFDRKPNVGRITFIECIEQPEDGGGDKTQRNRLPVGAVEMKEIYENLK